MKSISPHSNTNTRRRKKKKIHWKAKRNTRWERRNNGGNSGFEMPTRLSSWDRPLSLVYSRDARCCSPKIYIYIFALSVYLFRNDCPRNCGTGPPWAHREVVVLCLCCMGAPVWLSLRWKMEEKKRSNAGAHEIDFFFSFPLVKKKNADRHTLISARFPTQNGTRGETLGIQYK